MESDLSPCRAILDTDLKFAFPDIILEDQDLFSVQERWEEVLKLLPGGKAKNELQEEWSMDPERASADKWQDIRDAIKAADKKDKVSNRRSMLHCLAIRVC